MQQRLPSLLDPPITFAHRGAKAYAPDNTIESFELALKLGATGLESDVWLSSDGIPVLDHDGEFKAGFLRKRPIDSMRRDELPEHIPSLIEFLDACGSDFHLSLDLKASGIGEAVIDAVRGHSPELLPRLWLCDRNLDRLIDIRAIDPDVKLIDSTRLRRIDEGPERRAARLAEHGIDGINLHATDWNGGLVSLFHRFERVAFSWDLQFEHVLRPAFRMGIDGVYSDYPDRMVEAFKAEIGTTRPDAAD